MSCQRSPPLVHAPVQPTRLVRSGCAPTAPERHAPSSSMDEVDPSSFESHLPSWGSCLRLPRRFTGFLTALATPLSSDPLGGYCCGELLLVELVVVASFAEELGVVAAFYD